MLGCKWLQIQLINWRIYTYVYIIQNINQKQYIFFINYEGLISMDMDTLFKPKWSEKLVENISVTLLVYN